jgi:hypothetical protein
VTVAAICNGIEASQGRPPRAVVENAGGASAAPFASARTRFLQRVFEQQKCGGDLRADAGEHRESAERNSGHYQTILYGGRGALIS